MKKAVCLLMSAVCIGALGSCGKNVDTDIGTVGSPDGTWELVEAESQGKYIDAKKEDWFEQFKIKGTDGSYSIKYDGLDKTYDVTVEKKSGDDYDIKMRGKISLGTAKFGTKKMVYETGSGKDKNILVYEKK